jgi:D-beta-D-heptose 7-phosphate kinase/D-beta-D-heptose 1-phosphate adenosyltransferase
MASFQLDGLHRNLLVYLGRAMNTHPRFFLDAQAFLAELPQRPARLCFTNGCFDLLHPGHVRYLEDARALGDFLVVGLNSDDSVARLKGVGRPLQDENARASVLLGLRSVDAVVRFGEDTPLELIKALRPDILVKGGDYTPDTVVGRDAVEAKGGHVVIIPLIPGHSTSRIEDRIRSGRGVTLPE